MSTAELESLIEAGLSAGATAESISLMRDRYRGVILGVAAGNALGLLTEGRSSQWIRAHLPDGVRDVPQELCDQPWDDDLAQTVMLAEALVAGNRLDVDDIAARLLKWAQAGGHGIGFLTLGVVRELASGTRPKDAARLVWERSGRTAAGNGAVMRCSPVALRWRQSARRMIEETKESAAVTHYDPRCIWSAVALNAVLVQSLGGVTTDLGRLAALVESAGAPREVGAAVRFAQRCGLEDLELDDPDGMGYTLKAMQVGLWCLNQPEDFEAALIRVVSMGGDTDTNGAVAGAVMGGRTGLGGIPQRWIANIHQSSRLLDLADRLLDQSER